MESIVAKPEKAGSKESLKGRDVGECLPFISRFLEPRSQRKASTCCVRTALSVYLLLLTAAQGLLMYKGKASHGLGTTGSSAGAPGTRASGN